MEKFKIKLEIPGLLFIDSPGHAAFTSIRKRGSSIADLAILVIDITEGIQEQTDESIKILKEFKTPFLVAATKIDKIEGWIQHKKSCFLDSFNEQPEWVKQKLDEKLYRLVGQLSEREFDSERFDRVTDYKKTVTLVPCSGITGEGIPELLVMLAGLAQSFLKEQLEVSKGIGRGSVLEVKELRGLGTTIDVILYDGEIRRGDWIIVGGKKPIVTRVKALLKPHPLKELRLEKQFENVDFVYAAAGIKISAPDLEKAVAGSPIATVHEGGRIDEIKKELQAGIEEIEFDKTGEGIILKADTLGSLEALIGVFKDKIAIKKAEIGKVMRKDVIEIESVKDPFKEIIVAFNVDIDDIAAKEAKDKSITILQNNIIYRLIEEYDNFVKQQQEKIKMQRLESIFWPAKIQLLLGHTFRQNNPAIVGIEVLSGRIKPNCTLIRKDGREVGIIESIQSENISLQEAKKGERVAVSIQGPTVGRQINEGDILYVNVPEEHLKIILTEFKNELSENEILTIEELRSIRKL